jgi:hypothetical protein
MPTEKPITNFVLCSSLLLDYMERLEDTTLYKGTLKHNLGKAKKHLESVQNKELVQMLDANESTVINLMQKQEAFIEIVAKLDPIKLSILTQISQDIIEKDKWDEYDLKFNEIM